MVLLYQSQTAGANGSGICVPSRGEGAVEMKRGYSRDFTPRSETYGRYLLDKIPAQLWNDVKAKAKREGISMRGLILKLLKNWLAGPTESE